MYIEKVLTSKGVSGYFNKDLKAIKAGASPDGLVFQGRPMTPGFHAVIQPGESLSIILILSDMQVAFGDCIDVILSGAGGRDPLFKAEEHREIIEKGIADYLVGRPVNEFREIAQSIDSMEVSGKKLHTAIRYGITQALLDTTAKANHLTIAEVIASEYGCTVSDKPIPLLGMTLNEQKLNIDKMILKKIPYLPHGSLNNLETGFGSKGEKLLDYIHWLVQRINLLRDSEYHPTIHLDLYGLLGEAFRLNIPAIAEFTGVMQKACSPFPLVIETPILSDSRGMQIRLFRELRQTLQDKEIDVKIIADEWCNTLDDIETFTEKGAVDIVHIKMPDLGGINNSIEAVLLCKEKGVGAYLGGTANGTDQSARISAHVALATRADFLLLKPGLEVDEGLMIEYNEMKRALTLIKNR